MQKGLPDIIICCNGVFAAWELKVDSKPSEIQSATLELISMCKGIAEIVTPKNLDQKLSELLKKALKNRNLSLKLDD